MRFVGADLNVVNRGKLHTVCVVLAPLRFKPSLAFIILKGFLAGDLKVGQAGLLVL